MEKSKSIGSKPSGLAAKVKNTNPKFMPVRGAPIMCTEGQGVKSVPFDQNVNSNLDPLVVKYTNFEVEDSRVHANITTLGNVVNFRYMDSDVIKPGFDVVLPKSSVQSVQKKLEFTLHGYFLGHREAFLVVKSMMNSNGFFFFKFEYKKGQRALDNP